jgi:hypothetical protein
MMIERSSDCRATGDAPAFLARQFVKNKSRKQNLFYKKIKFHEH